MKKLLAILALCGIFLLTVGCRQSALNPKDLTPSPYSESISSVIEIRIKEAQIKADTEKITLTFENTTDEELTFGFEQELEIKLDGKWYAVPLNENSAWNEMAGMLAPNAAGEQIFALSGFYKEIVPGNYRIVKNFTGAKGAETAAVEFTIL